MSNNYLTLKSGLAVWRAVFDVSSKKDRIRDIEEAMKATDFWENSEKAGSASEELAHLKEEVSSVEKIDVEAKELSDFINYIQEDKKIADELEERVAKLADNLAKEELKTYFGGRYDKNGAVITVYSGAGGLDAQDWARMLYEMYERYCGIKNWKTIVVSRSLGEERGIKEISLEIGGKYAYGYLKNENGVHRLVRISPFSSQKLRHTSFALVEVLPRLDKGSPQEMEIRPEDIELQTFRSSGPGGQYVNKTESAVRIKHLPSGIVVECQSERLQGQNKEKAMRILAVRLFAKKEKEEKDKLDKLKGGFVSAEWGNQIRSYVLHPYKMVKDHRTGVETSDVEGVMEGKLEEFIEAEVKLF